jgi:hypothetical protein
MKLALVLLAAAFPYTCLAMDDIDAFILSYLENQKPSEFEWARAESLDRERLRARLREVVEGKTTTVGGIYGIGPWSARTMLIGIGDEDAIRETVAAYHKRLGSVGDIVELGQPLGIPLLAVDLTSDEFLYFDDRLPDGRSVRVKDTPKRRMSARSIVGIVVNSEAFTEELRTSARRLQEITYVGKDLFVQSVTEWWLENRYLINTGRYRTLSEFRRSDESETLPIASAESPPGQESSTETEPAVVRQPPETREARGRSGFTALALAVATAVILVVLLLRRRRDSGPGLR